MSGRFPVYAAPAEHFGWLCSRTGYVPTPMFQAIEAMDSKGEIRGMVGYDSFTPNSVQMSIAVDSMIAVRALAVPAFDYAFNQLGKSLSIGIVSSRNGEALTLNAWLGYQETYRIRDAHSDGIDLVILELRRADCRWLKKDVRHAG